MIFCYSLCVSIILGGVFNGYFPAEMDGKTSGISRKLVGEPDRLDIVWDEVVIEIKVVKERTRVVAIVEATKSRNGKIGGAVDPSLLDYSNSIAPYINVEETLRNIGQHKGQTGTDKQQRRKPRLARSGSRKNKGAGKGANPNGEIDMVEDTSKERAIESPVSLCSRRLQCPSYKEKGSLVQHTRR